MNRYRITRGKSISRGLNFLWVEEEYVAEFYKIDDNGHLCLYDEYERYVASFAPGFWTLIEKIAKDNEQLLEK